MPIVTVNKIVDYTDPVTTVPYYMTATVLIQYAQASRDRISLDAATMKVIAEPQSNAGGRIKYMRVVNVGANTASIGFQVGGNYSMFEIPAGTEFDLFGVKVWDGAVFTEELTEDIVAKGNTVIEVEIFA